MGTKRMPNAPLLPTVRKIEKTIQKCDLIKFSIVITYYTEAW